MDVLTKLPKITDKSARRCGRGYGSTSGGHTVGRGQKGQKSRTKIRLTLDGTKIKKGWIKRLPFLRGKNRLSNYKNITTFTLSQIDNWFKKGDTVDIKSLAKLKHLSLRKLNGGVKILSTGEITKALKFDKDIILSKSASKKIITAGGKIN